ncbi:MAG: efflux RND transporter permease subunit [Pseudomonadales bacterium]
MLLAILAIGGVAASTLLPVALFPKVDFPRVVVSLDAGDRPADQMVIAVTLPAEQAVRSVPGVTSVRSTTSRGTAELSINFAWGSDIAAGFQLVESAINQALAQMPVGTTHTARRMDPTVFPVAAYSLTSTSLTLVEQRDIAQYQLVPLLSAVEGVSNVTVSGGALAEYRVDVDPMQLASYGLTFDEVVAAVSAANILRAVGRLEDHYKLYLMLSDTRLKTIDDIKTTVLRSGTNGLVMLEDIASVYEATEPQWVRVAADGRDAVLVQVYQQPGANTVKIADDVKRRLDDVKATLPPDLVIGNWYDQSELIVESAKSVRDAIVVGIVLAGIVLLVFLRSLKITLIAILVVPAVLATTIVMLYALGMSFDIMTLGGMAAAVGLIVDDAIVMIEHIVRRLRSSKDTMHESIRQAAMEFTRPLTGSSAATIIIFVPLAFLTGVTGAFFKALSLTMASALVFSYLTAWLAVPLLADHLLSAKDAQAEDTDRITRWAHAGYRRLMDKVGAQRWLLLLALALTVVVGYFSYLQVGSGFIPKMDEGGFVLDYRASPGTSLTETDRLLKQAEAIVTAHPAVLTYSRRTGMQLGGGLTEANEGDFFIRLKPFPRAGLETVMEEIRVAIDAQVPGLEIDMALLMEDLIGDLTAVPQPIEIKLYGNDQNALMTTAPKLAEEISKITGVVDVRDGIVLAGDALNIVVDRDKAALEGVSPEAVTLQLNQLFAGEVTTQIQQSFKLVGIRVWVPKVERASELDLNQLWMTAPDGHRFPLSRIATVKTSQGQPQISRDNLKNIVAVTARIAGRDMGSTVQEIEARIAAAGTLPAGVSYEMGGLYQQQQIAFRGLMAVFIAAVALVFLLLVFLYEDFLIASVIMLMPLLAMSAVFLGLWLTRMELNITAMMGMTMIIGIVTEVSIFYFSEYQELHANGKTRLESLREAGINRMRPIVMTTLAAILALLPLALGIGQGSAMQQPLAIAIISGLIVQVPLVLVLMPGLYRWIAGGDLPANATPATNG